MGEKRSSGKKYYPHGSSGFFLILNSVLVIILVLEYYFLPSANGTGVFHNYILPAVAIFLILQFPLLFFLRSVEKHLPIITTYPDHIEAYCTFCDEVSSINKKEVTAVKIVGAGRRQRLLITVKDPEKNIRNYSKKYVQKSNVHIIGAYLLMKLQGLPVSLKQFYSGKLEDQIQIYLMNVRLNARKNNSHFCIPLARYSNKQRDDLNLAKDIQSLSHNRV